MLFAAFSKAANEYNQGRCVVKPNLHHFYLVLLCLFVLVGCGGDSETSSNEQAASLPFESGQRLELAPFSSRFTGGTHPIKIYLPHKVLANKTYPVIYILDGEWHLDKVANSLDYHEMEVIVIGVGNDTELDPANKYKHREDYSQWPLAEYYFDFLVNELAPQIEPLYPIDKNNRTVMGHSYQGLFAGLALLMDDVDNPFFHRHVAIDGSFWAHTEITPQLISDRAVLDKRLNSRTLLISARGRVSNGRYVDWFEAMLKHEGFSGLEVKTLEYPVDHNPLVEHAMNDIILALYED